MTGQTHSTEEQALKNAVAEASMEWFDDPGIVSSAKLVNATAALDAFRTPKAEEVPARCEPPEWARKDRYHWLEIAGSFVPKEWSDDRSHWRLNAGNFTRPEDMAAEGWRYHSPAKPLPTEQEPTRQAIRDFARMLEPESMEQIVDYTLDALRTFKPLPAEIEVSAPIDYGIIDRYIAEHCRKLIQQIVTLYDPSKARGEV